VSCIRHRPLKSGTRLSAVLERYIAEHTGRAIHDHKQVERLCDIYSYAAHTSMHMLFLLASQYTVLSCYVNVRL
jgi:hypothetical protein